MKQFLSELKRRQVVKPMLAYAGISWLILQVIGVVADMITVHPMVGPAVLLFLVSGFPVIAYLSWYFDFSVDGITRTTVTDEDENAVVGSFGLGNWLGLILILLVSGFIGINYFDSIKDEKLAQQEGLTLIKKADSIAVLPFIDQSEDLDQSYLALGLSEEITNLLGRADGFKVSASRSSQILSERSLVPVEIGRQLNVDAVLTGSVRTTGSRLRVRVELLDTKNGLTLWSESFLRELKDVFELEAEISRAIVNLLQDRFIESGELESLSSTKSVDAYVVYLKGREEYRKQTTESMKRARELFEQAIAIDPEYAIAYVALADTVTMLSDGPNFFGVLKSDIAAVLAEQNLEKAMVREPDIAQIYAVMGVVRALRNQFEEALIAFDKSLQLNSSLAITYMWKSNSLLELQRFDEAILAQQKAKELDPLFVTNTYNLGILLLWQGRFEEAEATFVDMKKEHPNSALPYKGLASLYFSQGNFVESIKQDRKAISLSPEDEALQYRLYDSLVQLGLIDILKSQTDDPVYAATILIFEENFEALFEHMEFMLEANPEDYWVAFEAGWYHAMFGDKAKAIRLLLNNSDTLDDFDKYTMPFCSPAIEIAWAKMSSSTDQTQNADLNRCFQKFEDELAAQQNDPFLIYLGARIYALKGNHELALQLLQKAVDMGFREWWAKYDPLLESLKNEQLYLESVSLIDKDLSKQSQEVRELFAD